jgi:polyisoprenoid-binding protein YceI
MYRDTCVFLLTVCVASSGAAHRIEIESGVAVFSSPTTMSGIEVTGKSSALTGHVELSRDSTGLVVGVIEAVLPVKTLSTGMKVRDEHMKKYIFRTADGQEPDLRFASEKAACPGSEGAREFACQVVGNLTVRGVARPFSITLNVKDQAGPPEVLHASGDGVVKLSDYGIERPSQFGVKSLDEVKLHLEFTGKQGAR